MVARASGDIFQILRDYNLDRATGPALKNLAAEFNVPVVGASAATSFVTVTDLSFQKISTLIYAGANPPIAGSTTIFVSNASSFPATGAIYIGRGSVNVEGPISYGANSTGFTGVSSIASNIISGIPSTANLLVGFTVFGAGIPTGTTISSIDSSSQIHISNTASTNGTAFTYKAPPVQIGSFWEITLDSPTTKFHNISETVILSQGGVRTVPVNTIVISPGIGTTPDIQYSVTQSGIILDGETTVTNIPIVAVLPGSAANVPAGAISEFSGNPTGLPNAFVTNPLGITTGLDTETDDELRINIKNALASTGLGTVTAIESALQGVQDPTGSDTIVSTDVLNSATNTTVYIDNGAGLEATHTGVAIETIVNSALGGEKFFQLVTGGEQTSVTKAFLQTVALEPFALSGGEVLTVVVGNITYEHTFASTDFANPGSATAYEVCASINADTLLNFEAVTAGGGTYVVIRPEDEVTNKIQVTTPASSSVTDANSVLEFPSQIAETLRLYKNGKLLTEDGSTASIFTQEQSLWSPTLASGETLSIGVDGTSPITYTLTDADFVAEGTYTTLSYSNSLQSWVNVLNSVVSGITASIVGSTIEITSNLGAIDRAQINIVNTLYTPITGPGVLTKVSGSGDASISYSTFLQLSDGQYAFTVSSTNATAGATYTNNGATFTVGVTISGGTLLVVSTPASNPTSLIAKGVISISDLFSKGVASDYILDRNTAQIELVTALVAGDSLSAGTPVTQANIESSAISSGSLTLSSDAHIWISIDTNAVLIPTIISGSLLSVTLVGSNTVRYTSNSSSAFSNVLPGDYVIVWSPQVPSGDQLEGRVHANTGSTLDIKVTAAEYAIASASANNSYISGFAVVRTSNVPQKFRVQAGTKTLNAIAIELQTQTDQLQFNIIDNTNITITSNSDDLNGQITVVTSDTAGSLLNFKSGLNSVSQSALIAYYETQSAQAELPLFFHSTISSDSYAEPIDTYVTNFSSAISVSSFDPNELIQFLNPYGIVPGTILDDEQPSGETVQMSETAGSAITILPEYPDVRRLRVADRFYIANPLDFGYNDSVVVIVDNNTLGETYTLPLYRNALVNSTYAINNYSFNAYDTATGPTASFSTNFTGFDFSNFKALLQAKYVLQGSNTQTALLYRSTAWGASGEYINVSYVYPSSANQAINSSISVTSANNVSVQISLASGNPITTNISSNTKWNVTITPNTPTAGIDQVTYNWAGQYTFTVSSANATAGATYVSSNGQNFTVTTTIAGGTTLVSTGSNGAPPASGTLTKTSGTGDTTITFSSFSFSGTGTSPALTLSGGEYVTILPSTGFNVNNTGTFRISTAAGFAPTSTSFTVQRPDGVAVAQTNVTTSVLNGIYFYQSSPTTAAQINTYVNANLSNYFTTTIVNDGGTSGSGIIVLSTYEDSGFTIPFYFLKDGINWIANDGQYVFAVGAANATVGAVYTTFNSNNQLQYFTVTSSISAGTSLTTTGSIGTPPASGVLTKVSGSGVGDTTIAYSSIGVTPQFTFKKPLTYPSDTGYSFNAGDTVVLVPTTMDQVQKFWSILAVTGFTTVGNVEVSDRGTHLQLATNTVGSVGSIQIVGGSGNEYVVPVLTSGELLGNNEMIFSANSIASQAVASDQWFRAAAQNYQNKNTGFSSNTSVTVLSNTPISGESTVILENQTADQLYFGSPRNYVRVEGDTFRIEKQGSLACLSWNGVGSSPNFSTNLNFNDSGGWTLNVSATGTYTVASGNTNFSELSIGDLVTVTGAANAGNNGTFFVEGLTGNSFTVSNPNAVAESGTAIAAGAFTSTSSVSEGDSVILASPFSPLNQGTYRVIRMFNNSIWYENDNAIEEEITCVVNPISTGYDSTSVFNVVTSLGTQELVWTGTGTPPNLQNVLPGDVVTFGTGFNIDNQGSFMVTNSGPSQVQITQFTMPAGSTFSSSGAADYFELYNGGNSNQYYVWFNVSGGSNTDPAPVGFTGIEVTINASDSSTTVANELYNALNGHLTAINVSVASNVVTATNTVSAATNSPVDVSMPAAFSFVVTQTGQESFLTVISPEAVNQSSMSAVTFSVSRPQIQFFQYDATIPGDKLVINGSVLGTGNAGTYEILEVLSPTTAIIAGVVSTQYNTNLSTNSVSLSVQEGKVYTGYKQVAYISPQPGTTNFNNIVLNTSAQYDKINLSANVGLTSLGKLNFPTTFRSGIDSYNFDIGLIGEANRVIYGDPRDSITYPGVNAAGTDIFIREPLLKNIQISLAIRTNIGVSFAQITSQIQSTVYALIQSNPLGQSIDLSSIVEAVRAIPGVISVVITNPAYTVASDEIQLVTGEKAFIANQISDISVSLIGS
jgi:hypothetical protein